MNNNLTEYVIPLWNTCSVNQIRCFPARAANSTTKMWNAKRIGGFAWSTWLLRLFYQQQYKKCNLSFRSPSGKEDDKESRQSGAKCHGMIAVLRCHTDWTLDKSNVGDRNKNNQLWAQCKEQIETGGWNTEEKDYGLSPRRTYFKYSWRNYNPEMTLDILIKRLRASR